MAQVVLSGIILFELYRFITRHLSVKEIGVWSMVLASTAVGRLADMGLGGGVVKFVAEDLGRGDRASAARTVCMSLVGMAALTAAACLASYPVLYYVLPKLIAETAYFNAARDLLPYALSSLFVSALSGVVLSGLDGCQRMDRRAVTSTIGAVVQLAAAYLLVPRFGLRGLAGGQVIQGLFTFATGAFFLVRQLEVTQLRWSAWDGARFKAMLSYGGSFQAAALGQLLFEPVVKALLTRFGGLEFTGYYEMANRLLLQLRSVIVSAFQALVPYVAGGMITTTRLQNVYVSSYRLLFLAAVPYYSLIGVTLPLALTLWLGRFESKFVLTGAICLAGWSSNTMNVPAYFLYLATGRLRWTVLSHFAIGLLACALGTLGGWLWGGLGVLGASAFALSLGSHVVPMAFHREYRVRVSELMPLGNVALLLVGISGVIAAVVVSVTEASEGLSHLTMATLLIALVDATLLAVLSWRDASRERLVNIVRELLRGPA